MSDTPLLAIHMVTYNHEKYIAQAIESVISQRTDFKFKLFIGDDKSTDNTSKICLDYQQRYPQLISYHLNPVNLGAVINSRNTINRCFNSGAAYTAILEGDDYWTKPLKLQKQVDFLEANPDFAICFHNVVILYESDTNQSHLLHDDEQPEVSTFEDLAKKNFIPTLSCVFRHNLFGDFPDWTLQFPLGDWILHLLNAQHGKIKYLNETMGVYRVHSQGDWGNRPIEKRLITLAKVIQKCREHFYPRGNREFTQALKETYKNLSLSLFTMFETGDYKNFRHYYYEVARTRSSVSSRMFSALTVRYLVSYIPLLRDFYKKITKVIQQD